MNIDRLLKKQQLNVQEQNAVSAYKLALTAKQWRIDGVPSALNCFGKPSFEFAKLQAKIVENEGNNLLGKRMEVLDNVRIELDGCENIGRLPTCTFELTNLNVDRSFRFDDGTRLFDESGGPLKFESIRVGQVEDNAWLRFPLIRNVPTRVTLIFQQSNSKLSKTPAIKLVFRDGNDEALTVKFSEILMR